jgi:quercetin dioxygenase-like cupin family protein
VPDLEVLTSTEHADERGRITTFLPHEAIIEYNLVTLGAGQARGYHWHPHFIEYLLFTAGHGHIRWRDKDGGQVHDLAIYPGLSTRAVPGIVHAVEADTDLTFVAMLTRRWDDCHPPIVRELV